MPIQISRKRLYQIIAGLYFGIGSFSIIKMIVYSFLDEQSLINHISWLITGLLFLALGAFFLYKSRTVPDQTIVLCGVASPPPQILP